MYKSTLKQDYIHIYIYYIYIYIYNIYDYVSVPPRDKGSCTRVVL